MGRVIVVANQKGGVGKTTTVVNLSAALARLGFRVVAIDLDSQGALSISLGFDPYVVRPSICDVLLAADVSLADVLCPISSGLNLAPANAELIAAEYRLYRQRDRTSRLRDKLTPLRQQFDFVLLDTPPNLGLLTVNGLVAADELLIPVAANYLSMRGVRSLLDSVWLIRERMNPDLRLLGVLPTMVHSQAPHAQAAMREMRAVFRQKVFRTFIPYHEVAATAPALRKTLLEYAPDSPVAVAYHHLAKEVSHAG